jgi:hypothetical protein
LKHSGCAVWHRCCSSASRNELLPNHGNHAEFQASWCRTGPSAQLWG